MKKSYLVEPVSTFSCKGVDILTYNIDGTDNNITSTNTSDGGLIASVNDELPNSPQITILASGEVEITNLFIKPIKVGKRSGIECKYQDSLIFVILYPRAEKPKTKAAIPPAGLPENEAET